MGEVYQSVPLEASAQALIEQVYLVLPVGMPPSMLRPLTINLLLSETLPRHYQMWDSSSSRDCIDRDLGVVLGSYLEFMNRMNRIGQYRDRETKSPLWVYPQYIDQLMPDSDKRSELWNAPIHRYVIDHEFMIQKMAETHGLTILA